MANKAPLHRIPGIGFFLTFAVLFAIGFLAYTFNDLLQSFAIAFALAFVVDPFTRKLEKLGLSRHFAITVVAIFVIGVMLVAIIWIVPAIFFELAELIRMLPDRFVKAYAWLESWVWKRFDYSLPASIREFLELAKSRLLAGLKPSVFQPVANALKVSFTNIADTALFALELIIVPSLAVYFLYDFENVKKGIKRWIPPHLMDDISRYSKFANEYFGLFLRGQLTVVIILCVLYSAVFKIVGIPLALGIGLLCGLGQFIPYLGPIAGFFTGLVIALTDFQGWLQIVYYTLAFLVIQNTEGWILTPKIVGGKLGLKFLPSILSLIIFGRLFGFIGMVLAIPLAAVSKHVVSDMQKWFRQTAFFQCGVEDGDCSAEDN